MVCYELLILQLIIRSTIARIVGNGGSMVDSSRKVRAVQAIRSVIRFMWE